jgi:predicted Zn-dependent peptidase
MRYGVGIALLWASGAWAQMNLHVEADPLPLAEVVVVLPFGVDPKDASESGLGHLWSNIFEAGTGRRSRDAYLAALGSLGAQSQFQFGLDESTWSFRFPVPKSEKEKARLVELLSEPWSSPRWTQENFRVAKTQLEATLMATLDNDMGLGGATLRRWMSVHAFGARPLFREDLDNLSLGKSRQLFEKRFKAVRQAWAGFVGPAELQPLVEDVLKISFPQIESLVAAKGLKPLRELTIPNVSDKFSPVALVVDKPERNQIVISMMALSRRNFDFAQELAFRFGLNLAIESGLSSIFGNEIRTQRGLAYSVGGGAQSFRNAIGFSIVSNPKSERAEEALAVFSDLVDTTFKDPVRISNLKQVEWDRQWMSFKYGRVLGRATASARLDEISDVVSGFVGVDFYKSKPEDWRLSRTDVAQELKARFADSAYALAFVGDAKQIEPLLKKHFPGLKVQVIPYRSALSRSAFL